MIPDKYLEIMPRSNKKKAFPKSPPKQQQDESYQISKLFTDAKNLMISRAISSGRKHGVDLTPGTSNPGLGDCAFQSVIQNNNCHSPTQPQLKLEVTKEWVGPPPHPTHPPTTSKTFRALPGNLGS